MLLAFHERRGIRPGKVAARERARSVCSYYASARFGDRPQRYAEQDITNSTNGDATCITQQEVAYAPVSSRPTAVTNNNTRASLAVAHECI